MIDKIKKEIEGLYELKKHVKGQSEADIDMNITIWERCLDIAEELEKKLNVDIENRCLEAMMHHKRTGEFLLVSPKDIIEKAFRGEKE
jgi:hypothetical protein